MHVIKADSVPVKLLKWFNIFIFSFSVNKTVLYRNDPLTVYAENWYKHGTKSPLKRKKTKSSSSSGDRYVAFLSVIRKRATGIWTQWYADRVPGLSYVFWKLSVGIFACSSWVLLSFCWLHSQVCKELSYTIWKLQNLQQ